ncbi:MAG TPA: hypothetical protein VFW73_05435 [Lacipirellulaceae bacterium]|nr:hypothetical protein [Lacipirellulaceae bacterium]
MMNHIIVRDANYFQPKFLKMLGSLMVIRLASFMAVAIQFNNELC